jgi:hypothetical protein
VITRKFRCVLVLTVGPGAACVPPESADRLSLPLDVPLVPAGTAPCCSRKEIKGSVLRSLQAPMVSGEAQYFPVYQEWIRQSSEQAWRDAMEACFRAE